MFRCFSASLLLFFPYLISEIDSFKIRRNCCRQSMIFHPFWRALRLPIYFLLLLCGRKSTLQEYEEEFEMTLDSGAPLLQNGRLHITVTSCHTWTIPFRIIHLIGPAKNAHLEVTVEETSTRTAFVIFSVGRDVQTSHGTLPSALARLVEVLQIQIWKENILMPTGQLILHLLEYWEKRFLMTKKAEK